MFLPVSWKSAAGSSPRGRIAKRYAPDSSTLASRLADGALEILAQKNPTRKRPCGTLPSRRAGPEQRSARGSGRSARLFGCDDDDINGLLGSMKAAVDFAGKATPVAGLRFYDHQVHIALTRRTTLPAGLPACGGSKKKDTIRLGDLDDATDDLTDDLIEGVLAVSALSTSRFRTVRRLLMIVNRDECERSGRESV